MGIFDDLTAVTDSPLIVVFLASGVIIGGVLGVRHLRARSSLAAFLVQLITFAALSALLVSADIVPYRHDTATATSSDRLLAGSLATVWWLVTAWLATGFLRAFVVLGHRPHESKLGHDLIAALIYIATAFAIVSYVFDLPIKGLLATSGALAIIIGLALQSSLGDVFSGIVLNLERSYQVGDWIILDNEVQGTVVETNWRATHILTGNQDIAIIPNSVIAKTKIVNCSAPTKNHGASMRVKLVPSLAPTAACDLLKEVLFGTAHISRSPAPQVSVKDISSEAMELELSFSVNDINALAEAQNEIFNRLYHAVGAAGVPFAPRTGDLLASAAPAESSAERLLSGVSLFSTLSVVEKAALAREMTRKEYQPGDLIVKAGTVMHALCVVSYGVSVAWQQVEGRHVEHARLTPGIFFGENGLLMDEPTNANITALTKVVIYEISKTALLPLLKSRPSMADELSEALASRRLSQRSVLDHTSDREQQKDSLTERVTASIKRMFSLH